MNPEHNEDRRCDKCGQKIGPEAIPITIERCRELTPRGRELVDHRVCKFCLIIAGAHWLASLYDLDYAARALPWEFIIRSLDGGYSDPVNGQKVAKRVTEMTTLGWTSAEEVIEIAIGKGLLEGDFDTENNKIGTVTLADYDAPKEELEALRESLRLLFDV